MLVEASQEASVTFKVGNGGVPVPSPPCTHCLWSPGRPAKAPPQRALSVEDVSAPSQARTVGRVVEVFPDGTTQLQLQRSPEGTFGFCVASGNGRRDSGKPPAPFWAPHPWGLSKPQQCLLAVIISSLWLRSGALNADSLLAKGLEFSLQALFWKGLVWGCWRGQR